MISRAVLAWLPHAVTPLPSLIALVADFAEISAKLGKERSTITWELHNMRRLKLNRVSMAAALRTQHN